MKVLNDIVILSVPQTRKPFSTLQHMGLLQGLYLGSPLLLQLLDLLTSAGSHWRRSPNEQGFLLANVLCFNLPRPSPHPPGQGQDSKRHGPQSLPDPLPWQCL